MPQTGGSAGGTLVYRNVTVITEERSYEDVLAIQLGDTLGIISDLEHLEDTYGPGPGPGPEKLFKAHARYVVPWRRVIEIDRGERAGDLAAGSAEPDPGAGSTGEEPTGGPAGGRSDEHANQGQQTAGTTAPDERDGEDEPDNVFDDL